MAHKRIETKYYEERASFFADLKVVGALSRRGFMQIAGVSAGIAAAKRLIVPQSFQLIEIANAAPSIAPFTVAYVSDTHLYTRNVNDRFIRSAVKAVEDVNALDLFFVTLTGKKKDKLFNVASGEDVIDI